MWSIKVCCIYFPLTVYDRPQPIWNELPQYQLCQVPDWRRWVALGHMTITVIWHQGIVIRLSQVSCCNHVTTGMFASDCHQSPPPPPRSPTPRLTSPFSFSHSSTSSFLISPSQQIWDLSSLPRCASLVVFALLLWETKWTKTCLDILLASKLMVHCIQ